MKLLSFLLFSFLAFSAFPRPSDDNLDRKHARERKSQIQDVSYDLFFDLKEGADTFFGISTITVKLHHTNKDLTLDSLNAEIQSLKVNEKPVTKFLQRKGSFEIPRSALAKDMKIEVAYTGTFSKDGRGFKRVIDPVDKEEYLYTDFEPYYAHWLFPCFDQPDLKASFVVTVKSPLKWKIVSNELLESDKADGAFKLTRFKPTPRLSTYLFFLGAGPWAEWNDKFEKTPLVIYARKSMAKFMDAERQFETLKKGLAFFNDYFDYPYPFSKYGQIYVPDFVAGAMENPGAVTFNEQRFLFRGPMPSTEYENRDNVILHEMAHMWFGDLVTMEWWNDLWLNESFATYAATLAQERAMKAKFADVDFLATKNWGYWQDQLVTTHPIETEIPDVRASKGIFDGITYAKGGSALKQLHFYVGDVGFRDGLRSYFKTFAWQNTQRKDFIRAIAKASGKDLEGWTKKWLQTKGPHSVKVALTCADSKVTSGHIVQEKNAGGVYSPHKTRLAFYKTTDGKLEILGEHDVIYETAKTEVAGISGTTCPDFLLPNAGDYDYALYSLDESSLKHAGLALKKLPDPLSRYQVWSILIEMVRNRQMTPEAFLATALEALTAEQDEVLLGTLLGRWSPVRNIYFTYLTPVKRIALAPSFEKVLWDRYQGAKKGSSLEIIFLDFYLTSIQSQEARENVFQMLLKDKTPKGEKLDQDRRWVAIKNLAAHNYPGISALIDEEVKKDASTLGKRYALGARVAIPEEENKKKYFEELRPKNLPFSDFREASDNFFSVNAQELNKKFLKPFYEKAKALDWKSNDDIVDLFFDRLFPYEVCTQENKKLSERAFKASKGLTNIARKSWLEANDELSRCVKILDP